MKNTTFTRTTKKVITTLTAAGCMLSVSAGALGNSTISNVIFGNAIVADAAANDASTIIDARNGNVELVQGKFYISPNKLYVLVFQGDGNLVVYHYNPSTGKAYSPTWSSQTEKRNGKKCILQGDGNFVIYRSDGKAIWNTRTNGKKNAYLTFSNSGVIRVVSRNTGSTTWSSTYNHGYSIDQGPIIDKPADGQLSAHFHSSEFACKRCGKTHAIDPNLIDKLEALYTKLNCSKIIVNSGYRDPDCSVAVGGYRTDAHTLGLAADVVCYDKNGNVIPCETTAWAAEQIGFTGIGLMNGGAIHLDVRTTSNYSNGHWFGDERTGNNNIATFKNYHR